MALLLDTTACQQVQLISADLSPDPLAGVIGRAIDLGPAYRYMDVQRAWTALLRTHPGLRVRFHETDGRISQEVRDYEELPEITRKVLITGPRVDIARGHLQPYGPVLIRAYWSENTGEMTLLVHHAVADEHALGIMADFLRRAARVPEPISAVRPADYAATVKALNTASRESHRTSSDYWLAQLSDGGSNRAPVWRTKPETPGGRWGIELDAARVRALREGARAANVSVPILVHTAMAILLHRYGIGDRPVIGVPISLRDHPAIGFDTVGLYLTALPVAIEIDGDDRLDKVLARVRTALIGIHEHKFLPPPDLPGLAALADTEHQSGRYGITLAVRQMAGENPLTMLRPLPTGRPASTLHVDLVLSSTVGNLTLMWRDGVMPWPAADVISTHLLQIVDIIAATPGRAVSEFALTADDLPASLPGSGDVDDTAELVSGLISRACVTQPDSIAVSDQSGTWSYAELRQAVGRVRAALRTPELAIGGRVGVACGRSKWQIAAILAVWQEGLCYVPLNPTGPAERNRMIVEDADLATVIGDEPSSPTSLTLDVIRRSTPVNDVPTKIDPSEPAYVMYTSGTGGRPKGVVLTHANLASFALAMSRALPITSSGQWLAETDATFDISLVELVLPLAWGQSITLADVSREPTIDNVQFDYRQCTPSRARQVLTARELGEPLGHWSVHPRVWLIGGEAMPAPLASELRAAYPDTTFVNMYGPTETTVWSACHVLSEQGASEVPLGTPLPNTELAVVDRYGWPASSGMLGELLIGGQAVAVGYLRQPDLTAERFREIDGRRMYRSGDLVVRGPDHDLYFRGRADDQIKIRGHRIEPAEVEANLLAHEAISEAAVFAVTDDPEKARLDAVVVPRGGHRLDPDHLASALTAHLPSAMIPTTVTVVDSLPRLPSGKIDRRQIRVLAGTQPKTRPPTTDPRVAAVADAMSQVIGRPVNIDDDFFRTGGNSVTALRVVALLRKRDIRVQPLDVFTLRTPRRIADETAPRPDLTETIAPWPQVGIQEIWQNSIDPWHDTAPSPLVPLLPEGRGYPLFCVHSDVGTVRFVAESADTFRVGHPVYGLEMVGYRDNVRPLLSIIEMAERYVTEIRKVQRTGPYHLTGLGLGAVIAVEMARMLRSAGQGVAPLALVDPPIQVPPRYDPGWGLDQIYAEGWESMRVRFGVEGPADLSRAMTEMIELGWYETGQDPMDLYRLQALRAAGEFALDHHDPAPYHGRAVLFKSTVDADRLRTTWGPILTNAKTVSGAWESPEEILRDQRFGLVMREILSGKEEMR